MPKRGRMHPNEVARRSHRGVRFKLSVVLLAAGVGAAFCGAARGQQAVVTVDPASTNVDFTLGATLHTVHGAFQVKRGEVRFDPETGQASGEIVVDATSGDSGSKDRDKKMHEEVLESQKYPDIVFAPSHVQGAIPAEGPVQIEVAGVLRLHGQDHPMTLVFAVERSGDGLQVTTHFAIPYVKWGLKNPSTFILRVSDTVDVDIHATGRVASKPAVQ